MVRFGTMSIFQDSNCSSKVMGIAKCYLSRKLALTDLNFWHSLEQDVMLKLMKYAQVAFPNVRDKDLDTDGRRVSTRSAQST